MFAGHELPICAVCRTRVARLELVRDPARSAGMGGHSFIAHCHGARDVVDLGDLDLLHMLPSSMRFGIAFGVRP